jgi:alpha-L-arabinofuranosidase
VEEILLESDSLKDTNLEEHGKVVPKADVPGSLSPEGYNGRVRPFSWKMIRILVDEK